MLHTHHLHEIAIVDPNSLSQMGLKSLLQNLIPQVTVRCFGSFSQLMDDTPDMFAHYFVAAPILLEHTTFFLDRKEKCFVMVNGVNNTFNAFRTLDTSLSEEELVRSLLRLHEGGHKQHPHPMPDGKERDNFRLSPREVEVLVLIVRGLINKEIADRLNISLTTVISHRKNITEKLGIRSVSGLTVYAVMNGLIEANQI